MLRAAQFAYTIGAKVPRGWDGAVTLHLISWPYGRIMQPAIQDHVKLVRACLEADGYSKAYETQRG